MLDKIKIHVLRTGEVRVSPYLPFGGDDCSIIKASGITTPKSKWIWLPVFSFLIEHPKGLILFDTGWHREMSPDGVYDRGAQIKSLGSWFLYQINQGRIARGEAIDEQLAKLGLKPSDIDYVLLSHLDCDLLEHRTDGTDAFDTLYIGAKKFPYRDRLSLNSGGVL